MGLTDIRKFRSSKACYLLDLNGNILNEFDNLQCCARFLNKKQFQKTQFNNGCAISKKYRVFTIDYYNENKKSILKLKNYTRVVKEKSLNKKPVPVPNYVCDLSGNIINEFKNLSDASKFLNKKVINNQQYNNGSIISKKYRVFSKEYFDKNKDEILKLKNYSSYTELVNSKRKKRGKIDKRLVKTILFPNQEFTKKEIAVKLKRSLDFIRKELNKEKNSRRFGLLLKDEF